MNLYQRQLDPVRAAILYAIEPIWAAAFGSVAGTDTLTTWLWIGGGLILAGNVVTEVGLRNGRHPAQEAGDASHCVGTTPMTIRQGSAEGAVRTSGPQQS
jgi:hypothetical protein